MNLSTSANSISFYGSTPWYISRSNDITIEIDDGITRVGDYLFANCTGLKKITFFGSAPVISNYAFSWITADCYYYAHKSGWESVADQNYGGTLTWHSLKLGSALPQKVEDDKVGFFVLDYETGFPVADVEISVGYASATTDQYGFAQIAGPLSGEQTVNAACDGYLEQAVVFPDLQVGQQYIIQLPSVTAKPRILSAVLTVKDPKTGEETKYNILKQKAVIDEASQDLMSLQVEAEFPGCTEFTYQLVQNASPITTNDTGVFSDMTAASFAVDNSIFLLVKAEKGTSASVKTNWKIKDLATVQEEQEGKISFGKTFTWTIPSNIPCIGGGELSLDLLESLPVYVESDFDSFKIAVNLFSYDSSSGDLGSVFSDDTWDSIVSATEEKDLNKLNKALEMCMDGSMTGGFAKTLKIDKSKYTVNVWGYLEGSSDFVSGKINFTIFDYKTTHEYQYLPWGFPIIVTWEFKGKLDASATVKAAYREMKKFSDLEFSGNIHPSASFSVGAGPGLAGLASLTINGMGQFDIDINFTETGTSARSWLTFSAFFKAKLLLLQYKKTFAKKTVELFNGFDPADNIKMSLSDYHLRERTEAAAWSGARVQKRGGESACMLLQDRAYGDSHVNVVTCGGKQMLFFLTDDSDRPVADGTKLVYTVYDENSGWSQPKTVEDNGTADFMPDVYNDGNTVWVAWMDAKESLSEIDETDHAAYAAKMEIRLAQYDPAADSFTVTSLTDDDTYDAMPSIVADDGTVYAVWVKNTNNSLLLNEAGNQIMSYDGTVHTIAENLENVTEVAATVSDGALSAAYITDGDGDYMTTEDRSLAMLDADGTASVLAENKTITGLSHAYGGLFWNEDGMLASTIGAFEGPEGHISGSCQLLETNGKCYIVFPGNVLSEDSETLSIELFAYVYDKTTGRWGDAVQLTSLGKTVTDFKAYEDMQGRIRLIVTASDLIASEEDFEERSSLYEVTMPDHPDLLLSQFHCDDITRDGEAFVLDYEAVIANIGTKETQEILLVLYDETGAAINSQAIDGVLLAGETRTVSGRFLFTSIAGANSTYTVKSETEGDSSDANNSKSITLAKEHIRVRCDDYAMFDKYAALSITMKNEGLFAAAPTLECRLDANNGELLFSDAYTIEAGETVHAVVQINLQDLPFEAPTRNLYIKTAGSSGGFFFVLYAPHDHAWTDPVWSWNADHTEATVVFACTECLMQETVSADITIETTELTENTDEFTMYTATAEGPDGRTYTDTYRITFRHAWGAPSYEWDENNRCTATRVCLYDGNHVETELAEGTVTETIAATCEQDGMITYTAVFANEAFEAQTRQIAVSSTGHDWDVPTYVWAEDNSMVTASRVCKNDETHEETETVDTTFTVIQDATTEADGFGIYSAVFLNEAFGEQTKEVVIPRVFMPLYGDVDEDGEITSSDAALILRALVGLSELTEHGATYGDVDGDGEITAADASAILRYTVGLIISLPIN